MQIEIKLKDSWTESEQWFYTNNAFQIQAWNDQDLFLYVIHQSF